MNEETQTQQQDWETQLQAYEEAQHVGTVRRSLRSMRHNQLLLVGVALGVIVLIAGVLGPQFTGQDYATLVPLAAPLLSAAGWLLCFFHRQERSLEDCEGEVLNASPVPLEVFWRGTSGIDFPEDDPQAKLRFTAFATAPPG